MAGLPKSRVEAAGNEDAWLPRVLVTEPAERAYVALLSVELREPALKGPIRARLGPARRRARPTGPGRSRRVR
jgi:hypothetical protein